MSAAWELSGKEIRYVLVPRLVLASREVCKPFSKSTPSSRVQNPKRTRWPSDFLDAKIWRGFTFPSSRKISRGSSFLKRDQVSGAPTAYLGTSQVDVYSCSKPGDWLPMSDEARVRSLLKK